jgi:hypothetical protein
MHTHLRQSAQPSRKPADPSSARASSTTAAIDAARMLELQRLAGNAGVLRVLQRSEEGTEDDDDG